MYFILIYTKNDKDMIRKDKVMIVINCYSNNVKEKEEYYAIGNDETDVVRSTIR